MKRVICDGLDMFLTNVCGDINKVTLACDPEVAIQVRKPTEDELKTHIGATHVIEVPGDTGIRGVQALSIETDCGCYTLKLYFDCPMPIATGKHTETPRPTAEYCCPPEPDGEDDEALDNNGDNDEEV